MSKVSIKWPIAGAMFGTFGWWLLIYVQRADRHTLAFGRNWILPLSVLCPWGYLSGYYDLWLPLNCVLYAFIFWIIRKIRIGLIK